MPLQGKAKAYKNIYFIEIDALSANGPPPPHDPTKWEPKHVYNLRNLDAAVSQHTDWKIERVFLPARTTEARWFDHMNTIVKDKTKDDLLIVYWHGQAGGDGEDYTWVFNHSSPKRGIAAYDFIEMLCECLADCMILVDSYMPTRYKKKWQRTEGITEIITSGGQYQDINGFTEERAGRTFTDAIAEAFKTSAATGGPEKTLPELLSNNTNIPFPPKRIDVVAKANNGPSRLYLAPIYSGGSHKITVLGDMREDKESAVGSDEPAAEEETVHGDEGYDEPESVESNPIFVGENGR